eukprot:11355448-Alexandrium_andersonii.AAC.1
MRAFSHFCRAGCVSCGARTWRRSSGAVWVSDVSCVRVDGACVAVCVPQGICRRVCAEEFIKSRKVERSAHLLPELSETCACAVLFSSR